MSSFPFQFFFLDILFIFPLPKLMWSSQSSNMAVEKITLLTPGGGGKREEGKSGRRVGEKGRGKKGIEEVRMEREE